MGVGIAQLGTQRRAKGSLKPQSLQGPCCLLPSRFFCSPQLALPPSPPMMLSFDQRATVSPRLKKVWWLSPNLACLSVTVSLSLGQAFPFLLMGRKQPKGVTGVVKS